MDGGNGAVGHVLVDEDGDLDLGCGDHLDVDAGGVEGIEHAGRGAGVGLHAGADNRDLRDALVDDDVVLFDLGEALHDAVSREFRIVFRDGEGDVLGAATARGLQDDIDVDFLRSKFREQVECDAGLVFQSEDGKAGDIAVFGDASDEHLLHFGDLLNHGTGDGIEAGKDFQFDVVFLRHFDGTVVQDLGAEGGEFQHFVVGDLFEFLGVRDLPRVGGVDAFDIGEDLAFVGVERGCQSDSGGVGTAAAEGRDVIIFVEPLKAGHNDDLVLVELGVDAVDVDLLDAGHGVLGVRLEPSLPAKKGDDRDAQLFEGHGQERDGDLLTGGQELVHFPAGMLRVDLFGFGDEVVRGVALGGDDDDDVVAVAVGVRNDARDVHDALCVSDGRTAEFLYDECHCGFVSSLGGVSSGQRG